MVIILLTSAFPLYLLSLGLNDTPIGPKVRVPRAEGAEQEQSFASQVFLNYFSWRWCRKKQWPRIVLHREYCLASEQLDNSVSDLRIFDSFFCIQQRSKRFKCTTSTEVFSLLFNGDFVKTLFSER